MTIFDCVLRLPLSTPNRGTRRVKKQRTHLLLCLSLNICAQSCNWEFFAKVQGNEQVGTMNSRKPQAGPTSTNASALQALPNRTTSGGLVGQPEESPTLAEPRSGGVLVNEREPRGNRPEKSTSIEALYFLDDNIISHGVLSLTILLERFAQNHLPSCPS